MSLLNKYYDSKKHIKHSSLPWTIIFHQTSVINPKHISVLPFFYKTVIDSIYNELNIDDVYLYISHNILQQHKNYFFNNLNIKIKIDKVSTKINIIKLFLEEKKNIIYLDNMVGYINFNDTKILNDINNALVKDPGIYSSSIPNTIDTLFLIINYADITIKYINQFNVLPNDLIYSSKQLDNNIYSLYDKRIYSLIQEMHIINIKYDILFIYDNNNYIYYPNYDIFSNKKTKYVNTIDPYAFNTNGAMYNISNQKIYKKMFKRWGNNTSGIFIKKNSGTVIIPKILHYVVINDDNSNTIKYKLRDNWKIMIWNYENIYTVLQNTHWHIIYNMETNNILKNFIMYLAILNTYGGIIFDSSIILNKSIPDDFLYKKIIINSSDDSEGKIGLSFDILGSLPGYIDIHKKETAIFNGIEKIHHGRNIFFKNIGREKIENVVQDNKKEIRLTNAIFFDSMYKILSNDSVNKVDNIKNFFIEQEDLMLIPDYMKYPDFFANDILFTKINNLKVDDVVTEKPNLKRNYIITENGINALLSENPKNRLRINKNFN